MANYDKGAVKRILQASNMYTALGLTTTASIDDVENSYARQVNIVNHFINLGASNADIALTVLEKAYETLKYPKTRYDYDYVLKNYFVSAEDQKPTLQSVDQVHISVLKVYRRLGIFSMILLMLMLYLFTGPEEFCKTSDDYYAVLGVSRKSTISEIKTAYRKLAKHMHPDKKTFDKDKDAEQFRKLVDAYKVISNLEKRKEYDMECEKELGKPGEKTNYRRHKTITGFDIFGLYSLCVRFKWCVSL